MTVYRNYFIPVNNELTSFKKTALKKKKYNLTELTNG